MFNVIIAAREGFVVENFNDKAEANNYYKAAISTDLPVITFVNKNGLTSKPKFHNSTFAWQNVPDNKLTNSVRETFKSWCFYHPDTISARELIARDPRTDVELLDFIFTELKPKTGLRRETHNIVNASNLNFIICYSEDC